MKYKNSTKVRHDGDLVESLTAMMSEELAKEIDNQIMEELITEMKAQEIIDQQRKEERLRTVNPALKQAWEEYQVVLRLVQSEFQGAPEVNT